MESFHIQAQWDSAEERMRVTLRLKGQTFVERFDRAQWEAFIAGLDTPPLRIGGVVMNMGGDTQRASDTARGIRDYLRRVDRAFKSTGSTLQI